MKIQFRIILLLLATSSLIWPPIDINGAHVANWAYIVDGIGFYEHLKFHFIMWVILLTLHIILFALPLIYTHVRNFKTLLNIVAILLVLGYSLVQSFFVALTLSLFGLLWFFTIWFYNKHKLDLF